MQVVKFLTCCCAQDCRVLPPLCTKRQFYWRDAVVWTGILLTVTALVLAIIQGSLLFGLFAGGTLLVELFAAFYVNRFSELHPLQEQVSRFHQENTLLADQRTALGLVVDNLTQKNNDLQESINSFQKKINDLENSGTLIRENVVTLALIRDQLSELTEKYRLTSIELQKAKIEYDRLTALTNRQEAVTNRMETVQGGQIDRLERVLGTLST